MDQKKTFKKLLIFTVILIIVGVINRFTGIIAIPINKMIDRQVDYITISTVFAGFSFTSLGLLLGMSSEQLIVKIENTSIILKKIKKIITSIVFFIASVFVSLVYVLGFADIIMNINIIGAILYEIIYILGMGYLMIGIAYFAISVFELSDLIRRVYNYSANGNTIMIKKAEEQMKKITDYSPKEDDSF